MLPPATVVEIATGNASSNSVPVIIADFLRILANHGPTPERAPLSQPNFRPCTIRVNSTCEPRQLRRGPLPLSHTRQNVFSKIRFRGKRPRCEPLNTKYDVRCNRLGFRSA